MYVKGKLLENFVKLSILGVMRDETYKKYFILLPWLLSE